MPSSQQHAVLKDLVYKDDILTWGGKPVPEIVDLAGSTPLYIYSKDLMRNRVEQLRSSMPEDLTLHYAMKANPMPEVVNTMLNLVDGLDVASAGELRVALGEGADPGTISFAGPGKSVDELNFAVQSGVTVNVESARELARLVDIALSEKLRPKVALRVNPDFELKNSGMKMGGRPSQFGIDAEQIPEILSTFDYENLEFRGFHIYSGSQNLRPEAIIESMIKTVDLVIELGQYSKAPVQYINLGGGLGIPYTSNDVSLDLSDLTDTATQSVTRLKTAFPGCEVVMELGRFLVGESGIYVCEVLDIKESRGHKFAVTNGGLHHHSAATGNFGQVLRKNYPVVSVNRGSYTEEITVVGPLCTPMDLLGDRIELNALVPGSFVAILLSGAYGATASPVQFLSHPTYKEVVV